MRFDGQTAIVTGAANGIGRATVARLTAEGAQVTAIDIDTDGLQTLHRAHRIITCDIADPEAVTTIVTRIASAGPVNVLVNNAGILDTMEPITDLPPDRWEQVMRVNLFGAAHMLGQVARIMPDGGGAIVNTASVAGIRSGAGGTVYSASKAALINLTQTAACDLGHRNIRVNAVCPGLIETGMTRRVFDHARSIGKEHKLGARCELGRYGTPDEVAAAIAFLASTDASYITGQALAVDGGNTASLNMPGMKF